MNPNEVDINLTQSSNQSEIHHASILYSRFQSSDRLPWIVNTLIKTKIVKTDAGAQRLLLILVVLMVVISVVLFFFSLQAPEVNI